MDVNDLFALPVATPLSTPFRFSVALWESTLASTVNATIRIPLSVTLQKFCSAHPLAFERNGWVVVIIFSAAAASRRLQCCRVDRCQVRVLASARRACR